MAETQAPYNTEGLVKSELIERGWTPALIRKWLPEPECYRYSTGTFRKTCLAWTPETVSKVEEDQTLRRLLDDSLNRRGRPKRFSKPDVLTGALIDVETSPGFVFHVHSTAPGQVDIHLTVARQQVGTTGACVRIPEFFSLAKGCVLDGYSAPLIDWLNENEEVGGVSFRKALKHFSEKDVAGWLEWCEERALVRKQARAERKEKLAERRLQKRLARWNTPSE